MTTLTTPLPPPPPPAGTTIPVAPYAPWGVVTASESNARTEAAATSTNHLRDVVARLRGIANALEIDANLLAVGAKSAQAGDPVTNDITAVLRTLEVVRDQLIEVGL